MKHFARTFLAAGSALLVPLLTCPAAETVPPPPPKPAVNASIIITNPPSGAESGKARLNAPYLSSGISDIVRMFQAGVEEAVILAFIQSSTVAYHPSAREVIYLRDLGLPQAVLTALLKRGGDLRDRAAEEERNRATQPPPTPPAPAAPSAAAPATQSPQVVYSTPTYVASSPTYASYPSYSYAAYSYPAYGAYAYPAYANCSPYYGGYYGYGACRPYYGGYGYYGSPYFGFSYGSCGARFSAGFGYGGYGGYYGYGSRCSSGSGIRYTGSYGYGGHGGSYAYRGNSGSYAYRGNSGVRYAGSYARHR